MSYVECMKSELDLFTPRPIQSNILKTEEVIYKPIASLDKASVIEFVSLGHGETYRDLSSIQLKLIARMYKNGKNETLGDTEKNQSTVNNLLHSLIRQLTILLNNQIISQSNNTYGYQAYIEKVLNYGVDAVGTHVEVAVFFKDNGKMDGGVSEGGSENASTEQKANLGMVKRQTLFAESARVEMMGKIHGDMLNQPKLLLNNVDLRVVLTLEKPDFYMMADKDDDTCHIVIEDASMFMNHVTINPQILIAHETMLQKHRAIYPYQRVEVKSYTVPSSTTISLDNVVIGQLPNLLVFGMVDNDAFTGKRSKNGFNFKHNDIEQFNLIINGVQHPNTPIQFDYTNPKHPISTRGYNTLFKGTGIHFSDKGHQVTKEFFDNGCFLLAFDLSADVSNNGASCMNLLNQGTVRIEVRFAKPLPTSITCLVYTSYDASIEIDKNRNVYTSI